jgi:glutamyl-tRNA reductase
MFFIHFPFYHCGKILSMRASDNLMTLENILTRPSRSKKNDFHVHRLKIISFTHKTISLTDLSKFFLDEEVRATRLSLLRGSLFLDELFYLATCNRIEFIIANDTTCDKSFLTLFFKELNRGWSKEEVDFAVQHAKVYEGDVALHHIFSVASSLDSMVIGEREIITQVRKAYDECRASGLTGDFIRLVIGKTIVTAKQIYTETKIATHPVSIVSLAYRRIRDLNVSLDARILMVGAGETNTNFSKYLVKHGFRNFSIFNRSISNGEILAGSLKAANTTVNAYSLNEIANYKNGFDVLITCTGAAEPVITNDIYKKLLQNDTTKKIIIDLAMPSDVANEVIEKNYIHLVDIGKLKAEAEKNLAERHQELKAAEIIIGENIVDFHQTLRLRKVELAMKDIPSKIREIKSKAMNDVFADEINLLDEHSKDVLSKVLDYMEKKCISVPMLMAKEIILETN